MPDDKRPHIIYIMPCLPEPRDRGDHHMFGAMVDAVAELGNLTCICLLDREVPDEDRQRFVDLVDSLHVFDVDLQAWGSWFQQLKDPLPANVRHWQDPSLAEKIQALGLAKPDLLVLGDLVTLPFATLFDCDASRIWMQRSRADIAYHDTQEERRQRGPIGKLGAAMRRSKIASYEKVAAASIAGQSVCSPSDAEKVRSVAPDARIVIVPNGICRDEHPDQGALTTDKHIVFFGRMSYLPNVDGLQWFVDNSWELVRQRCPEVQLSVVGRDPTPEILALDERDGITVTGGVPSLGPYYKQARCVIAPIFIGGGTRLKVVECWSSGRPLVGTATAVDGLDAVDGENCLLADSPEAFAEACIRILEDDALDDRLRQGGLQTAARYSWDQCVMPFIEALRQDLSTLPPR